VLTLADPDTDFFHVPVMRDEVLDALDRAPAGPIVDATLGGAGHALALLERRADIELHGIDQDAVAMAVARERLAAHADRVHTHPVRFDAAADALDDAGVDEISGFLMDLGVSSPQLDHADRGFSYRHDGPLDMRMDRDRTLTAADVVNGYELGELIDVLRSYGDERHAPRIVRAIIAARPIEGTAALADVIRNAVPAAARRAPGHPAKRSFQAIRIEVNAELAILTASVDALIDRLAEGGIGLVLTYHSGEDRIVKDRMRQAIDGDAPAGLPITTDFDWFWRGAHTPTDEEIERNPRAKSARLRAIVRTRGSADG
jgi:16S rRNA (cytosine1402-N4)-methyltransferase